MKFLLAAALLLLSSTASAGNLRRLDGQTTGGGCSIPTCPNIAGTCFKTTCAGNNKATVEIKQCVKTSGNLSFLGTQIPGQSCSKIENVAPNAVKTLTDVPCGTTITIVFKDGQICAGTTGGGGSCVSSSNQYADTCIYSYNVICPKDGDPCTKVGLIPHDPNTAKCANGGEYKNCACVQSYKTGTCSEAVACRKAGVCVRGNTQCPPGAPEDTPYKCTVAHADCASTSCANGDCLYAAKDSCSQMGVDYCKINKCSNKPPKEAVCAVLPDAAKKDKVCQDLSLVLKKGDALTACVKPKTCQSNGSCAPCA